MDADQSKSLREERVLSLLHMLGNEAAEAVFPHLEPETAAMLRQRFSSFTPASTTVRKQKQILDDFERFLQFTRRGSNSGLKLHQEEDVAEEAAEEIVEMTGDPLIDIDRINIYQLASALDEEQPRTVAILLKLVSPHRIAQVVELLSDEKREQVIGQISQDPRAPELIMKRLAASAIARAMQMPTQPRPKDDPVFRLVEVLRATAKPKRRHILKAIEDQNPDQAILVNKSLYQFEDLKGMDDSQIQRILARVDSATLSTALFGADEEIVDRIMGNLSKRARASLQEELSFRKNVTGAQLRASRDLVTSAIAESEQETE
ncbi:MAG TPA: FliG C-terminal domain-containing protein [Planctomicrobium sp.]|nr:FliG C-terminal domain-containing protein [Planctomicrobium sp.]